jgi:UDP-glucose 4-epimerase
MSKEVCLVTGGLGFIGSHLVDQLIEEGHKVWVIDDLSTGNRNYANSDAEYEILSLSDTNKVEYIMNSIDPEWVFHLAALSRIQPSFEDPILHDENNVRNTLKLIEILKKRKKLKAFINSSSSSVYGNPTTFPTPENERIDPLSPYALQKYTSEYYIRILCDYFKIPAISLRYFNPYGERSFNEKNPQNAYSSVIGIFLYNKMNGIPLKIFGTGQQSRDFIHVSDVVGANICVANKIKETHHKVFNVGIGKKVKIIEIARFLSDSFTFEKARPGEADVTWAETKRLTEIGWKAKADVFDYLRKELL